MDDIFDGCGDGCFDGCFGIFGGGSGRSSSSTYTSGRVAGEVLDTVIDEVGTDESRSKPAEQTRHGCRGKGKPQRVILWLTVRKEHADEVVDMLLRHGRSELRVSKITLWMSLWAGLGWRRCAVVAHCYLGEEAELQEKLASLKREHADWIQS